MFVRRLRLEAGRQNWFGVGVDLVILILGVFLGIQVNNWNQARLDRAEGKEYLARLYSDLESNERVLAFRIHYDGQTLTHAREALVALDRPVLDDPAQFIIDAFEASNHVPRPLRQFTYDEVVGAGKSELLGDPVLRERIANYYSGVDTMQRLFDFTPPYRELIRSALPPAAQFQVMQDCPEVFHTDEFGNVTPELLDNCKSKMSLPMARKIAADVRSIPGLRWALNRVIMDLDQKIKSASRSSGDARQMKNEIRKAA